MVWEWNFNIIWKKRKGNWSRKAYRFVYVKWSGFSDLFETPWMSNEWERTEKMCLGPIEIHFDHFFDGC